jgi:hypothetical protein
MEIGRKIRIYFNVVFTVNFLGKKTCLGKTRGPMSLGLFAPSC